MPLSRITVMRTVHFYILVLLLLDNQIWRRLSTNTSCPQGKFPLILPCFWTGSALSFTVSYHPCPHRSRETGSVFQSLELNRTVSNRCWNFSNMFVAELVVIVSVNYSIGHSLEGLLARSCSQGVKHWVVCSASWVCMLRKSIALEWLVPVLSSLCPGCRSILDH